MSDIALDLDPTSPSFNDIDIVDGDLLLTSGAGAIQQHILQRLRTFLGEWFLDTTIGLPYFQQILVGAPNLKNIEQIFMDAIKETPGVKTLTSFNFESHLSQRSVSITFRVQTESGNIDYSGLIEV